MSSLRIDERRTSEREHSLEGSALSGIRLSARTSTRATRQGTWWVNHFNRSEEGLTDSDGPKDRTTCEDCCRHGDSLLCNQYE